MALTHAPHPRSPCHSAVAEAAVPMRLAGNSGVMDISLVKGRAPILFSKPQLKAHRAVVDYGENTMHLPHLGKTVSLPEAPSGHYLIPLCDFPDKPDLGFPENPKRFKLCKLRTGFTEKALSINNFKHTGECRHAGFSIGKP